MQVLHAGQAYELEAFNYDREKKDANQVRVLLVLGVFSRRRTRTR